MESRRRAKARSTEASASTRATSVTRLPTTPLRGGNGTRKARGRGTGLFAATAGEDCALQGDARAPSDLRARVDRQVRRPHAAYVRDRGIAQVSGLRNSGAGLCAPFLPHLPRALCCGLLVQGARGLPDLPRQTHERRGFQPGGSRFAQRASATVCGHGAFSAALPARLRREIARSSGAHLHGHDRGVVSPAPH